MEKIGSKPTRMERQCTNMYNVLYMYNVYPYLCSHLASSSWSSYLPYVSTLPIYLYLYLFGLCGFPRRLGAQLLDSLRAHQLFQRSPARAGAFAVERLVRGFGGQRALLQTLLHKDLRCETFWWFQKKSKGFKPYLIPIKWNPQIWSKFSNITLVKTRATEWWSPNGPWRGLEAWGVSVYNEASRLKVPQKNKQEIDSDVTWCTLW